MKYKIIDNFLPEEVSENIKKDMYSKWFPWYFSEHMTLTSNDSGFFCHAFYYFHKQSSHYFESCVTPIINKLDVKAIIEIRANLMTNKFERYESDWHCDRDYDCKTGIYYVNDSNGYTVLLDNDKEINVPCKQNTMLVFDGDLKHKAVSQTDNERRVVINFNYFD
jgi:hypothetical protein